MQGLARSVTVGCEVHESRYVHVSIDGRCQVPGVFSRHPMAGAMNPSDWRIVHRIVTLPGQKT